MAVQKLGQAIEFDLAFGLLRFASICSCATVPCIGGEGRERGDGCVVEGSIARWWRLLQWGAALPWVCTRVMP
jgi:hypothetical protein